MCLSRNIVRKREKAYYKMFLLLSTSPWNCNYKPYEIREFYFSSLQQLEMSKATIGGPREGPEWAMPPVITSEAASTRVFEYSKEYRVLDTRYSI